MKLMPGYDYIDFVKYAFVSNKKKGSYVYETWDFDHGDYAIFCCEYCSEHYDVKELEIINQAVHCKCGAIVKIEDFIPYHQYREDFIPCHQSISVNYYRNRDLSILQHNFNNGTLNKINVPTIIANMEFYCPHCHEKKDIYSYKKENDMLICDCGQAYTFEECKIQESILSWNTIGGDYYIDNNKISISLIQQHVDENRFKKLYWSTGNTRATINLETGYSYVSNTGCCYTDFNKQWKRYHNDNSNAPKLFNATYNTYTWGQFDCLVDFKIKQLQIKYINHPNLVNLINNNRYKLSVMLKYNIVCEMDRHMTKYYNNKYNYRIKSFEEKVDEYIVEHPRYDKDSAYAYDAFRSLVLHNRFINANYTNIYKNLLVIFDNLKRAKITNKYKKLNRETNEPIYDLCNAFTSISKSLRKRITKDIVNKRELYWDDSLFEFLYMAEHFTKKENINKLYDLIVTSHMHNTYNISKTIKFWLSLRSEEYISNIETPLKLREKYSLIRDSLYSINKIKSVYGDDWNENSIVFNNERQYHDALTEIISSQAFKDLADQQRREKLSVPFEMEEEVFELENKDITIALNEYELGVIGNSMSICVGGYGEEVRRHGCRIAYIKHDDEYVACLELRTRQIKKDSEITYELHQAKLKHNAYVGTNEKYYNIVSDWCQNNQIEIKTEDMNKCFKNETKEAF